MINTPRLRSLYSKIQNQLFYMIPEKWDKIFLYASFIKERNSKESGEMFFYYFPKGVLRKNPINVYEIPNKFNIEEKDYMVLVDKLYSQIKQIRKEFVENNQKLWSNLTISIKNSKFNIEFNYENIEDSKYSSYDRHIIWKYKYLDVPLERFAKKDRIMIQQYLLEEKFDSVEVKNYQEGMYKNKVHNIIEYDRENRIEEKQEISKNIKNSIIVHNKEEKDNELINKYESLNKSDIKKVIDKSKNQILNFMD